MGIYDRDYYRTPTPRRGFGVFSMWSVTTWLIVVNVAIFAIDAFLARQMFYNQYGEALRQLPPAERPLVVSRYAIRPMEAWGYFSFTKAVLEFQAWRFLSFQFLHANLGHLFSNMLSLFLFGPIVENYLGWRRYLAFYLLCGCSGAISYMLLLLVGLLHGADVPLVGASAGIFGVLVAGAILAPDVTIMFIFPPVPIQLKYLALILVGWAAYTALSGGYNAGGQAAHIGGAALGYLLIRHPHVLNFVEPRSQRSLRLRRRSRSTDWSKNFDR